MKRRRPIPPLSIVRLVRSDSHTPAWNDQIGRTFRIGYYCQDCGMDCVWLVNDAGEYEQTVDQEGIKGYFDVVERSGERSLFGRNRPPIRPLADARGKARRLRSGSALGASHPTVNGKSKTAGEFRRSSSAVVSRVH